MSWLREITWDDRQQPANLQSSSSHLIPVTTSPGKSTRLKAIGLKWPGLTV